MSPRNRGAETTAAAIRCQDAPGDPEAWEELRRSVWFLLRKWARGVRLERTHLDCDDLLQEAWIVVQKAVPWWDRDRGVKFTSFLAKQLKRTLRSHAKDATGAARLPLYLWPARSRTNIRATPPARAHAVLRPTVSLDARGPLGYRLVDLPARPVAHAAHEEDDRDLACRRVLARRLEALERLAPRAAAVVMRRFAKDGGGETLRVIGADMGISKGRVLQLEGAALRMLRTGVIWPERGIVRGRPTATRVDVDFVDEDNETEKGDAA